jgi:hypothetical protein
LVPGEPCLVDGAYGALRETAVGDIRVKVDA